jgi:hypothetical protein
VDIDIGKNGAAHGDVSLGNPDDMVDEGNRWVSLYPAAANRFAR